jgi:hypothetical protein
MNLLQGVWDIEEPRTLLLLKNSGEKKVFEGIMPKIKTKKIKSELEIAIYKEKEKLLKKINASKWRDKYRRDLIGRDEMKRIKKVVFLNEQLVESVKTPKKGCTLVEEKDGVFTFDVLGMIKHRGYEIWCEGEFLGEYDAVDFDVNLYEKLPQEKKNLIRNPDNFLNNVEQTISVYKGDLDAVPTKKYDIILANINRHIIERSLEDIASLTNSGGSLLCSGFLDTDISLIRTEALRTGFELKDEIAIERWRCLHFTKI